MSKEEIIDKKIGRLSAIRRRLEKFVERALLDRAVDESYGGI